MAQGDKEGPRFKTSRTKIGLTVSDCPAKAKAVEEILAAPDPLRNTKRQHAEWQMSRSGCAELESELPSVDPDSVYWRRPRKPKKRTCRKAESGYKKAR